MQAIWTTRRRAIVTAVVAVALGGSQGASAARVTTTAAPGRPTVPVADATSTLPVIGQHPTVSADGRWVAFEGTPPEGDARTTTTFLQDREAGTVEELTPMVDGVPSGNTVWPVISGDGCTVTVTTELPYDLFRDDNEGSRWDVYRTVLPHCDGDGDWELVSAKGAGFETAAGDDTDPRYPVAVSTEGSVVAYTTRFGGADADVASVELVDLSVPLGQAGRTRAVAGTPLTPPAGTFRYHGVREPAMSSDGRFVAFTSDASSALAVPEWGTGPQPGGYAYSNVYVWDRENLDRNTAVRRVSVPAGPDSGDSYSAALSSDGSTVAFVSTATNLVPGATLPACNPTCVPQVYLLALDGGSIRLGSRLPGDPTQPPVGVDAAATQPALDVTGAELVYVTRATNLFPSRASGVGGATDGDIVRTVPALATVERVSTAADGLPVAAANSHPHLSANGRVVVFDTLAGSAWGSTVAGRQVVAVTTAPSLELADLDMGTVAVTFPGPEWVLNVTNNGPSSFVPAGVAIDQPDFLVSGGTCVEQAGVPVPPGGTCTVTLMFMPMVEGDQEATLTVAEAGVEMEGPDRTVIAGQEVGENGTVNGDAPDPFGSVAITATLTGFGGDPTMAPSPAGAHSRPSLVGARAEPMPFTIYNVAFNPVRVKSVRIQGAAADDFEVVDDECTGSKVDAGESCQLSVAFTPTAAGRRSAIVRVTTDDGAYTTMIVSGDGHYEPRVATSATTIVAGSRVSVTGTGYAPGATVTVTWADGSGRGVTAVTDDTGTFTVELVVLPAARPGARSLVASAGDGQVAVTQVLVVAAGRSAGPASPSWPGRP